MLMIDLCDFLFEAFKLIIDNEYMVAVLTLLFIAWTFNFVRKF